MELPSKCKIIRKMAVVQNFKPKSKFLLKDPNYFYHINRSCWKHKNYPVYIQKRDISDNSKPPGVAQCKVALVTGGARGIGYHVAEHLLMNGAQAVVIGDVLVDACEEATCKLNEKFGENKALFQPCDVTKKQDMEKIFRCTKDRFGKIDIVINNAGILDEKRWEQTINININGIIYGTLLGFQYMSTQNCGLGGYIINCSSILGLQPIYCLATYSGTKHFISGFTRALAHDFFYKKTKVKCMVVCPGITKTTMVTDVPAGGLPGLGDMNKEWANIVAKSAQQGPEEVAKCVIKMLKEDENGSVWVSEDCNNYKVKIPDRASFKPKDDSHKKKEDPCKKKPDPCQKVEDPNKKHGESSKAKEDPCKKKEDHGKKEDPCKKKGDHGKKEDPCKKKDDHDKKEDPCRKKDDHGKKDDPCKKKDDHGKKEDPCKKKDDHGKKDDPCRKNDGHGKKEDPCKKQKPCSDMEKKR